MIDEKDRTVEVEIITGRKYPYGKPVAEGDKILMDPVSAAEWCRMGWAKAVKGGVKLKEDRKTYLANKQKEADAKKTKTFPDKTADKKPDQVR